MIDVPLFRDAMQLARHAGERQRLIAENLANRDTPGYRSRDLAPPQFPAPISFAETMRATRAAHATDPIGGAPRVVEARQGVEPNGNGVDVGVEMVRAAGAEGQHRLALGVYGKAIDLMRLGLGRQR
ncbi:MAG: hypothetical protein AAF677_13025 [Pseudomonadota bacterium]